MVPPERSEAVSPGICFIHCWDSLWTEGYNCGRGVSCLQGKHQEYVWYMILQGPHNLWRLSAQVGFWSNSPPQKPPSQIAQGCLQILSILMLMYCHKGFGLWIWLLLAETVMKNCYLSWLWTCFSQFLKLYLPRPTINIRNRVVILLWSLIVYIMNCTQKAYYVHVAYKQYRSILIDSHKFSNCLIVI